MSEQNLKNSDLVIRISVAGVMPEEGHKRSVALSKFDKVMNDTIKHASKYTSEKYGFSEQNPTIQFITSPFLIDKELLLTLKQKYEAYKFINVSNQLEEEGTSDQLQDTFSFGIDDTYKSTNALMFAWICDQVDFTIVINEDGNALFNEYIRYCKYENIPSVSIFVSADRHMLWTATSYYESYDNDKLEAYLDSILKYDLEKAKTAEKRILGYKLVWGKLFAKYIKRNKVTLTHELPKDNLVCSKVDIGSISKDAEATKTKLLELFTEYDDLAIKYADKYRSSIYLRAVIPLFVTMVLAVGFYAETLLKPFQMEIPFINLKLSALVAGLAFFLHALLNLYVYTLSENNVIKSWHKNFINNRFIAETLRLAVHFIPFGIPVNYMAHLKKFYKKNKMNKDAIQQLRAMIKGIDIPIMKYDSSVSSKCMDYLEDLVNEQIAYHIKQSNQYAKLYNNLKKYWKVVFYIGFVFVLIRGGLQLYLNIEVIQGPLIVKRFIAQNIKTIKDYANMLALLLPAWAGYFSSKLSLCNFEGLYNNHMNLIDELEVVKQMINDEQQKDSIAYSDMYYLSKDVSSIILGDISEWYSQINARKVTSL